MILTATVVAGVTRATAQPPTPPPPIDAPPAGGEATPPAELIVDTVSPIQPCGGWYRASNYGGRWPTGSTWWEYRCGSGGMSDESTSFRTHYYFWDDGPVFYGTWFTEPFMYGGCSWWIDSAGASYGPYACGAETNAAPTAQLVVSCVALACHADATGSTDPDGTIMEYRLHFGDAYDATSEPVADHVFNQAGTYAVSVVITDNSYETSQRIEQVTVEGSPPPNPAPSASINVRCEWLDCIVDGSRSTDSSGPITRFDWDFGDGITGIGGIARHVYPAAGSYMVKLTVTDAGGAIGTVSKLIATADGSPPSNVAPVAAINVHCGGMTCNLDANASSDIDGTITGYRWDFGDGTTDTGDATAHVYASPGTYFVQLAVTDDRGAVRTSYAWVTPTAIAAPTTTTAPPTTTTSVPSTIASTVSPSTTVAAPTTTTVPATSTTTTPPLDVPGAPRSVTARPLGRTAEVHFLPPTSDGGSPISYYTARCTSTNGGTTRAAEAQTSPITVDSLTARKTYTCDVRASNAFGTGPASAPSSPFRVPR